MNVGLLITLIINIFVDKKKNLIREKLIITKIKFSVMSVLARDRNNLTSNNNEKASTNFRTCIYE